mmetsp:Transcript_13600/g.29449  ORF Transcript_13600/g.29449 Transcript_13600/m.29449 type:complete len:778 (-) Transcript_13600:128-2461(-)
MANLSIIKSVISPTKRTGAKKNLLKRDGITSDGINDDDDSSSLSDRQDKRKPKIKKRFRALKFFRRKSTKNAAEEDGYESDASTGSIRSTSSSFLRYQNRAIWRAKLMKKSVLQRFGDGSEAPVQDETKPWPMFDRIYKRQNQLKKGEIGENEDLEYDDDSVSSVESTGDDCNLGPPAPILNIGLDGEELMEEEALRKPCNPDGASEIPAEKKSLEEGREPCDPDGTPEISAEKESQELGGICRTHSVEREDLSEAAPEKRVDKSKVEGDGLTSSKAAFEKESAVSQADTDGLVENTPDESVKGSPKSKPEGSSGTSEGSSGTGSPTSVQESGIQIAAGEEPAGDSAKKSTTLEGETPEGPPESKPPSHPVDNKTVAAQASGIPTSETPEDEAAATSAKSPSRDAPLQDLSRAQHVVFPTQKLTQSSSLDVASKENKPKRANAKHPKSSREKKKISFDEDYEDVIPRSIPKTICYSLRSAIGDGSARQRNSHSLMERRPLRPNGSHLDTSYWSHRGKRNYMEDRFVIEHMGSMNKNTENSRPISLFAVFDGHGGSAASQFCSDWLSSYIRKKNEHFPDRLGLAMKNAFIKIDSDFVSSGHFDGTTACACAIVGGKVICCNSGDSRAIIVKRDGSAVALSKDHKPDRDDETKRINNLGGRVIHWGRWRVEGVLAVSRSIGDAKLKPYVTAEPDMVEHEIGEDDMFLVVASDGVWDTMTSDLVAKFVLVNTCKIVNKRLQVDDKLLRWIARQVSKRARENGSSDNISCIVANLKDNKRN